MKYNIVLSLLVFICSLTSCKKDDNDFCYVCSQNYTETESGVITTSSSSTLNFCDKSEDEIKQLEKDNTYVKVTGTKKTESTYKCSLEK